MSVEQMLRNAQLGILQQQQQQQRSQAQHTAAATSTGMGMGIGLAAPLLVQQQQRQMQPLPPHLGGEPDAWMQQAVAAAAGYGRASSPSRWSSATSDELRSAAAMPPASMAATSAVSPSATRGSFSAPAAAGGQYGAPMPSDAWGTLYGAGAGGAPDDSGIGMHANDDPADGARMGSALLPSFLCEDL